jgi:hypothetical protein
MIFSIKVFVTVLDYLKIPQVAILGDYHCLKGLCFFFQILVWLHCLWKLPTKLYFLTHTPSLLANWGRLWTFNLDKFQVRGRYNLVRDIRRSHCWPFCAHMSAWTLLIKRNCLVKIFSVSHVSVFGTGASLIPTRQKVIKILYHSSSNSPSTNKQLFVSIYFLGKMLLGILFVSTLIFNLT